MSFLKTLQYFKNNEKISQHEHVTVVQILRLSRKDNIEPKILIAIAVQKKKKTIASVLRHIFTAK